MSVRATPFAPGVSPRDAPVRQVPVACRRDPDRFFPDIDAATAGQKRILRRSILPAITAECDSCFFRIPCAIAALENQATAGVWAGVLVRHYTSPDSRHRKKLLAILAEHITTAAPTPQNKKLHDRILLMLSRRPELQPGFTEALNTAHTKKGQNKAKAVPRKPTLAPSGKRVDVAKSDKRKRQILPHCEQLELFAAPIPA